MSKHTPGPWRVVDSWNDYMVESQNGEEIIWQDGPHHTPAIKEADARLIAAAPDLLDALVMVLDDPNALDGRPRTYEIVCAAIAKAKGEV
jgi:hypothetical protein